MGVLPSRVRPLSAGRPADEAEILDEFCANRRYHRQCAVRLLNGPPRERPPSTATSEDPLDLSGAQLEDIPKTRDEVIAASKVLDGSNRLLMGPEATEAAFKAQPLTDFKIIRIAAHGLASTNFQIELP